MTFALPGFSDMCEHFKTEVVVRICPLLRIDVCLEVGHLAF